MRGIYIPHHRRMTEPFWHACHVEALSGPSYVYFLFGLEDGFPVGFALKGVSLVVLETLRLFKR